MMKTARILAVILICFLLLPSVVMSADSIYIPEDEFFEQHESQMVYLYRRYIANGEDGYAVVREAPGAKGEVGRLQNGEKTVLYYTFLYDGDYWGISDDGYIQMDQLLVLYDYISFEEGHFDELYLYQGNYEKIKETHSANAWQWPGVVDYPLWVLDDIDMEDFSVAYAYIDSQGREWGFVNDYENCGYFWICLSDPMNRDIPAFNPAPEPTKWVPEKRHPFTQIKPTYNNVSGVSTVTGVSAESTDNNVSGNSTANTDNNTSEVSAMYTDISASEVSTLWLIVVLVAVLVACTAVLIKVFWKRNKKEQGENVNH